MKTKHMKGQIWEVRLIHDHSFLGYVQEPEPKEFVNGDKRYIIVGMGLYERVYWAREWSEVYGS